MARKPRNIASGDVAHARTRFVNEEFRIKGPADRKKTLELISRAVCRTDTRVLAFAIMSSHVHLVLERRLRELDVFYRSFHTSLAMYLNREPGRLGPVVAGRPWIDVVRGKTIFECLRYVHENQRDADMAASLRESDWTSHPCFADPRRRPPFLDVERAAFLAGFAPTERGIELMVAEMESREGQPLEYRPAATDQALIREHVGAPVQMMTAVHHGHVIELPLVARGEAPVPLLVECEPPELVEACARVVGVAVSEVRGRGRRRQASEARALALYVWCGVLQRRAVVMATYLGRSESGASRLWSGESTALRRGLPKLDAVLAELGIDPGSESARTQERPSGVGVQ